VPILLAFQLREDHDSKTSWRSQCLLSSALIPCQLQLPGRGGFIF